MTIAVLAILEAGADQAAVVRQALLGLVDQSEREPGTQLFAVNEALERPGTFVVFERYVDDAAVAEHRTSEAMSAFRVALRGAGVSPQITFLTPLAGVGV